MGRWGITVPLPGVPLPAHRQLLRLGTAVVPVYTRGPALLAMSAAALAELAPGRFALGIGAFHDWLGRGDVLAPMHRAWAAGDRAGALAAIPSDLVDALLVHGPAEACRAHIHRYVENGLTTPVIALLPAGGDPVAAARALGR